MMNLPPEVQRVKTVLDSYGLSDRFIYTEESILTASQTAATLQIQQASIAKGILLLADNKPVLFMVPGNQRIDLKLAQTILNASGVRLATPDEALRFSGFTVRGISPIAHITAIPVYIHEGLKDQSVLYVAAGNDHAMFRVTSEELLKITHGVIFT